MKKNSGSALTSVVVVFLLVVLIGVPLLGMVVYNYRLREYDSGIKEAEYYNEMVMDRVATIIKNDVIETISISKNYATTTVNEILSELNGVYADAYQEYLEIVEDSSKSAEESKKNTNVEIFKDKLEEKLGKDYKTKYYLEEDIGDLIEIGTDEVSNSMRINSETQIEICNKLFKENYWETLIDGVGRTNGVYCKIYNEDEYKDLTNNNEENIKFGTDFTTSMPEKSLKLTSSYISLGGNKTDVVTDTYSKERNFDNYIDNIKYDKFEKEENLTIGIESKYRLNNFTPVTTISANFVIDVPNFSDISFITDIEVPLSTSILNYGLIVGDKLTIDKKLTIDGNLLAGVNGTGPSDKIGIDLKSGASLIAINSSRVITPGDIILYGGNTLTSGTNPIYYSNLYAGKKGSDSNDIGNIEINFNGDVLAKDDLEVNYNGDVTINQDESKSYYGFNDLNDAGPDSSSAIVINSGIDKLVMTLGKLYLNGRAFIDGVESADRVKDNGERYIYKTGESVSVKGNYIAYQTPLFNTTDGTYDVDKVKFSPYFMPSSGGSKVTINLVDYFLNPDSGYTYDKFDSEDKKSYFSEYCESNESSLKYPKLKGTIVHNTGAIAYYNDNVKANTLEEGKSLDLDTSKLLSKQANQFEIANNFGYALKDDGIKHKISDLIDFTNDYSETIKNVYLFVKSRGEENLENVKIEFKKDASDNDVVEIDGETVDLGEKVMFFIDGNLTIENTSGTPKTLTGLIVATGNLEIVGDINVVSDTNGLTDAIVNNYISEDDEENSGKLMQTIKDDGCNGTISVIQNGDNSNIIDINDYIHIKDWKKQSYGRL